MEITSVITMDNCPRCQRPPHMAQDGRYQVRCACGVCGPQTRSPQEAARRWRSVAYYMQQHQAYVGEMLQLAVHEPARPPGFRLSRTR